jgi:CheY-like chemotaxis protein
MKPTRKELLEQTARRFASTYLNVSKTDTDKEDTDECLRDFLRSKGEEAVEIYDLYLGLTGRTPVVEPTPDEEKRVYIVDDENAIRITSTFLLEHEGYEVRNNKSCKSALEDLPGFNPHLLILDCENYTDNPNFHGYELLEALAAQQIDVPTLVMSGRPDSPTARKTVYLGQQTFKQHERNQLGIQPDYASEDQVNPGRIIEPSYKGFLPKPFSKDLLFPSVDEILAVTQSRYD